MVKAISLAKRNQIVGMVAGGVKLQQVADHYNVSRASVWRIVSLHRQTGDVVCRPGRGRPRVTTPAQDRYITTTHLR